MHKHLPKHNDGSAHFVTTSTHRRTPLFEHAHCAMIVLEELAFYRVQQQLKVFGYVVMPDHLHAIVWWDNEHRPELTISRLMQSIKGSVARRIIDDIFELPTKQRSIEDRLDVLRRNLTLSSIQRHDDPHNRRHHRNLCYKIWQTSFHDFNIVSLDKLNEKLIYIHENPVRAGLCEKAEEYPFSSAWYYAGLEKPKGFTAPMCPVDEW